MQEALVLANDPRAVAQIGSLARVVQQLPPRLLLIAADEAALAAIAALSGIEILLGPTLPDAFLGQLTPGERIFADAWLQRHQPKVRRGDGLPWDAPGYEPPDRKRR